MGEESSGGSPAGRRRATSSRRTRRWSVEPLAVLAFLLSFLPFVVTGLHVVLGIVVAATALALGYLALQRVGPGRLGMTPAVIGMLISCCSLIALTFFLLIGGSLEMPD